MDLTGNTLQRRRRQGFLILLAFASAATAQNDERRLVQWPRGSTHPCGTLRSPGTSSGWRRDETDHCFPQSASDHMVCCVDIGNVDNEINSDDPRVAQHNPLSGPIRRNSNSSSYSWCTCSVSICRNQLKGRVAWVGQPNDQVEWHMEPPSWYYRPTESAADGGGGAAAEGTAAGAHPTST